MTQYYTDFTEYTLDAQPSDWTERWHTTVASAIADDQPPIGGGMRSIKITNTSIDRYSISWDDVGTPSGDVEVLAKVSRSASGSDSIRVYLHGSGTSSTESGYFVTFQATSVLLAKYVDGAVTSIGSSYTFTAAANKWYWVRLQRSSTTIRAKIWEEGEEEPASWNANLTGTDSSLSSGWVAFGNNATSCNAYCDWFSVGTGGDVAPSPDYTTVFHWLETPVDISPSTGNGSWWQTDISDYVSELSTGVIVRVRSTAGAGNYIGGVRVYGQSISYPGIIHPGDQTQYICGHNYGYIDVWSESTGNYMEYELIGYLERAVFQIPVATFFGANGWITKDETGNTVDESQAVFVFITNYDTAGANHSVGARMYGSTDDRNSGGGWSESSMYGAQWGTHTVPTDSQSRWQLYADNNNNYTRYCFYGYIPAYIPNLTWHTNGTERTFSSADTWESITTPSSQASTIIYESDYTTSYDVALRPYGSSDNYYYETHNTNMHPYQAGTGGVVQGKVYNTSASFWEIGYEIIPSVPADVELTDALTADTATITTPVVATTYWNTVTAEDAASASVSIDSGIFVGNLYKVALEKKVGEGSWYEIQSYEYGEDQQYQDDDVTANTWYYYRAARYSGGQVLAYSNEASLFYSLPIEVPEAMGAGASMHDTLQYFIMEGIELERKTTIDGTYALVLSGPDDLGYWDDPGPFVKETEYWYRARSFRDYGGEVSGWSDEQFIIWYGSIDVDVEVTKVLSTYSVDFLDVDVATTYTAAPGPMAATTDVFPPRLFFQSIFGVPPMEAPSAELTFYYAWGSGPSHTDHALVITAEAGVLEPVVIIPKVINTTVVLAGEAIAGGAARLRTNTARPDELEAEARLAAGDDAHDVDGFVVTVHKTTSSSSYSMGTTPGEEYVHYVSPEKREFRIYGVPADDRYHLGVRAYRQVDQDVFVTYSRTDDDYNVLYSDMAQYPAEDQPPITADSVDYTGNIDGVDATTVATGAQQGATAYGVTSTAFDSGTLIASWKPGSVTAVPYDFDGLFGNQNYLGYVTRGSDPASPVWHTYLDSDGNFYLGGSTGSNSGLAWDSDSNDLSINFDNASTGGITMNSIGYLRSGQTAYNTGTGFWLGYDTNAVKMSIGNGTQGMTWDGSTFTVAGTINVIGNPEDFQGGSQNFTSQPETPYYVNDTWTDLSNDTPQLWVCDTERLTGDFVASDWTISSARVFTEQPTTPYNIGDLWLDSVGVTPQWIPRTLKCVTALASGSFVSGHWEQVGDTTKSAIEAGTTITSGYIHMSNGGYIYSGSKTAYNSANPGFYLGHSGTTPVFGIGNGTDYLTWNGSVLSFSGDLVAAGGTFSGSLSAASGTFAGSLSAASGTFAGSLSAATGTFAGDLQAAGGTFSGTINASQVTAGTMSGTRISGGTIDGSTLSGGYISGGSLNIGSSKVIVDSSGIRIRSGWDVFKIQNTTGSNVGQLYSNSDNFQVQAYNDLNLIGGDDIYVGSQTSGGLLVNCQSLFYDVLILGSSGGPQITWGTGSPTNGTLPPSGSIYICKDSTSSLWLKRGSTWYRIWDDAWK